jgi:hypothetical protein
MPFADSKNYFVELRGGEICFHSIRENKCLIIKNTKKMDVMELMEYLA